MNQYNPHSPLHNMTWEQLNYLRQNSEPNSELRMNVNSVLGVRQESMQMDIQRAKENNEK